MLNIISDEMATNDWTGVTVSYNNEPTESAAEAEMDGSSDEGFPAGAIVGIALASVAALAAIIALIVFFLKDRREKELERMQPRVIPYGDDSRGSQSFDNEDDSDSDSSSSEDDMSGNISGPSLVSGGDYSFPTTMARANPSDVEQDDSSSSSDTSSGSDDEESGEYEMGGNEVSANNLKTSASSDEAPPIYEHDDMADYSQGRGYPDRYQKQIADDENNYHIQEQYHDDAMHYGQMRSGDDGSNGSGGSMGSMKSADPPGQSFRDLHQEDDWSNMLPLPPSMAPTSDIIDGAYYVDNTPGEVYEHDDVSNPGSYHSNASRRSSRSHRSNRSNRSKSKERSKSRDRNQNSYHSFYNDEDEYIGDVDQGSNGSRGKHSNQDYTDYEQQTQQDNYFEYGKQNYNAPQYDEGITPTHYNEDEYHNQHYSHHKDKAVDYGDDTTTFSDSTRHASNVHQQVEQLSEYEEDEESISNIFKSLSEIQTKLAKKGATGKAPIKGGNRKVSSANSKSSEGVVEDVSVDGSQVSSFEARAAKNRRPSAGNWMEPVDEYKS
jgi:hypothetical protein